MIEQTLLKDLQRIVGPAHVLSEPEDLLCYSYDGTNLEHAPDVVVLPTTTEMVSSVLALANREGIPVVPRGAGTGLSGGSVPAKGGIALALNRMDRIIEVDPIDMVSVVEPGVVTARLQSSVERQGLFFPPDPASLKQSTLGGNVAECAGGPRCLKYGVTKDYVLGLEVVLPSGEIIKTGGRAIKDVTGYNLTQLLVGSEGMLGVFTGITLRLITYPAHRRTAMAVFERIEDAGHAVNAILHAGLLPASIEIMDNTTIRCVEAHLKSGLPIDADAILLLEVDGTDQEGVLRENRAVAEVCQRSGAREVVAAETIAESDQLWLARRSITASLVRVKPNKLGEDVSVPRSAVPPMIRRVGEIARRYGVPIALFGHAGDGNLHPNILYDMRNADEVARVEQVAGELFMAAVELGGTLSGEHGIGTLKQQFMPSAVPPRTLELMRGIKQLFDPKGTLNPGKMFPVTSMPSQMK